MSGHCQASHECSHDFSDHFLLADEAGMLLFMTASSSSSASSLHSIFRPVTHLISPPGQPLTLSSTVLSFTLLMLSVSSTALQIYDHLLPACTISDQAYVNMPRFPVNGPRAAAHFCNLIVNGR
ncbi:uncharacterized protein BDCG_08324 [Blastomyces dermatitidis ER-3]|uniref:Uncharacterized protein n=1 Tax=Ajellomyces dermatitidis (strain ER-3 / ATCC MYA-2586) TaxID=559297 RepID=A0ABP2ESV9_AJEDR|nr:uncharacterized protein BDCG_08324 [Blastomyces dermatitidis ER-3]EEQ85055.2 hypothetical protein BDCG_08324 [Blastomyces dermatitidis ER-3]